MERKEALEKLLAKVEAGEGRYPFSWSNEGYKTGALFDNRDAVNRAYNGSLDAAKALHEDVLPKTGWDIFKTGEYPGMIPGSSSHRYCAKVGYGTTHRGDANSPARAWLIAILKALISEAA